MDARKAVERWNQTQPIGAEVSVRLHNGELRKTTTRSAAEVSPSGHAVISLNGIRGHYLLNRVSPLNLTTA